MGSCVSCNHSSHDQSDVKFRDSKSSTTIPDVQACGGGGGGGMRDNYAQQHSSSSAMVVGDRSSSTSAHHKLSTIDPSNTSLGIKGEKKTFYSRIPPLGRSGSDKKSSIANTSNSIKDNNNAYSESKIAALFEMYKDPVENAVLAEGIERLCKNLEVKPEDFKMLVLAWKFQAEQMCRFTREEFFMGMKELKTDTLQGVQARLPDVVTEVQNDPAKFKDLYRFSFKFALDSELGQRILPIDMAISLWRVVFSCQEPLLLERWIQFLEAHSHIRGIPRDTWNMFLNLIDSVGTDLSNYDDTEAWPSLFDDFVEFENDTLNQNTISNNSDKEQQFQMQPAGIEHSSSVFDAAQRLSNCSSSSPGATSHKNSK